MKSSKWDEALKFEIGLVEFLARKAEDHTNEMELSDLQKTFLKEWIEHFNETSAYDTELREANLDPEAITHYLKNENELLGDFCGYVNVRLANAERGSPWHSLLSRWRAGLRATLATNESIVKQLG